MTREEAIRWINEEIRWENECQSKHPIKEALCTARKALEQERRWIPVTERLPEESTLVLLSCDDMYLARLNPCIGWISENNYWFTFASRGSYLVKYPIAWMPLPEPYKEDKE